MSSRSSAPRGVLLAGVGAFVALGSLWLPWYTIKFPESFKDAFSKIGSGATGGTGSGASGSGAAGDAFAGLFKGLAAVLPSEITGKGWQVMSGGDVALAVAAGAALLLVVAVSGGASGVRIDQGIAGRLISLAGLVVTAIALYHVVSKPGSGAGEFSEIVQVKLGIWVAAAGGLAMILGGVLTGRPSRTAAVEGTPAPAMPAHGAADEAQPAPAAFAPPEAPAVPGSFAVARDPFADPVVESPVAHDPFASPDPYAAPAVESPVAHDPFASPDPYAAPAVESPVAHDPFASPDPYAAPAADPFAVPVTEADGAAEAAVPDWTGFSTPTPEPEREPEPEQEPAVAGTPRTPTPTTARPAGVSIPPPGWTPAS